MMGTTDDTQTDNLQINSETRCNIVDRIFTIMNTHGKGICFVLVLIFTLIAALQNSPIKTRKANPPQKFFPDSSLVTDYFTGDLEALSLHLQDHEVSLVMYYASWDASCMEARDAFDIAAKFHYADQVFFAAINCWWPEGQCYKMFTIYSYPVILAHVRNGYVRYTGPLVANYIISFVSHLLSPLTPLHSLPDLLDLQARHEAVAVGSVDWSSSNDQKIYEQFFLASLRALNFDPNRRVAFAVTTNRPIAHKLKMNELPSLTLYLWNRSLKYMGTNYTYREITDWIFSNLETVSQWLTPPGIKSTLLSQVVKTPTLFLFTPRHLLLSLTPYYNLLREVAMDYYNCNITSSTGIIQHHGALRKFALQQEVSRLEDKCPNANDPKERLACPHSCCQSLPVPPTARATAEFCTCQACLCLNGTTPQICLKTLAQTLQHLQPSPFLQRCDNIPISYPLHYGHFGHVIVTCHQDKKLYPNVDEHVHRLEERENKKPCKIFQHSLNYSEVRFPLAQLSDRKMEESFAGLRCQTNRTLQFIAMDSIQFNSIAERLGINLWKLPHHTACAIVETEQESQFILDGPITRKSLIEFITNYTHQRLPRHLRSSSMQLCPHCTQEEIKQKLPPQVTCVQDLSSAEFTGIVLDPSLDVVVLYYTEWCGFCKSISHVFTSVARQFDDVPGIIFAKINGELNDLPWHYTVPKYPTISFFPAYRKSESAEFPQDVPVTMSNLFQFVLAHSRPRVKWTVGLRLCSSTCVARNRAQLGRLLRRAFRSLDKITHLAHQHRSSPHRQAILTSLHAHRRHINHLRALQSLLMKSPDFATLSPSMIDQLMSSSLFEGDAPFPSMPASASEHVKTTLSYMKDEL